VREGGQQIASVGKIIQVQLSYLQFPLAAANAVVLPGADPVEAIPLLGPARTSRCKGWLKTLLPRRCFGTRRVEREEDDPGED